MKNPEIWVFYDGKAGHLSQSLGLAERLSRRTGAHIRTIKAYPRMGILRLFANWLCRMGIVLPRIILSFYKCKLPAGTPETIISFGGKIVPLNAALATLYSCDNILIGNRYHLPAEKFSVLVSATDEGISHQVTTPVPFSRITSELTIDELKQRKRLEQSRHPLWLLLLGGNGSGYHYNDQDWQALKTAMIELARQHDIRWLISNSRRTPAEGTALLSDPQLQAYCHTSINYQADGPGLGPYLHAAERIFVTADSLSMLTEAIACSKDTPAVGLIPKLVADEGRIHHQTLLHFQKCNWLSLQPIDSLSAFQPSPSKATITYPQVLNASADQIISQLARLPPHTAAEPRRIAAGYEKQPRAY